MTRFEVDDDIAVLVERLAKRKPFEELSFNEALRRILKADKDETEGKLTLEDLGLSSNETNLLVNKKAPSPSVKDWVDSVPELRDKPGLNSWKSVCNMLHIDTAGDSARRKLQKWVNAQRPSWPPVPDA